MKHTLHIILTIFIILTLWACRDQQKKHKSKTENITVGSAGMVKIPAGAFTMGSDTATELEAPARLVTTEEYWIDKFEYPNVLGELPLVNVTWHKARKLCQEQGKDLCTERQWEKACRGPEGFVYPYGNVYDKSKCRVEAPWQDGPAAAGAYQDSVSGYGVYDMSGNVAEWTLGESIEERAVRGGFWQNTDFYTRCSNRMFFHPTYATSNIGFRCVKSVSKTGQIPFYPIKATLYWAALKYGRARGQGG